MSGMTVNPPLLRAVCAALEGVSDDRVVTLQSFPPDGNVRVDVFRVDLDPDGAAHATAERSVEMTRLGDVVA